MSRDTIEVKICDRCGFGIEIRSHGQDAGWGRIWASAPHLDAARPIRTLSAENQQADICTDCADEFFAFWATAPIRGAASTNETTPPPPKRIDRAVLESRIGEALREQVSASVGAIQLEPSSILNPEIPSAALTGIDLRAKRLAKQLAKELG